jgi:hypothetical protein
VANELEHENDDKRASDKPERDEEYLFDDEIEELEMKKNQARRRSSNLSRQSRSYYENDQPIFSNIPSNFAFDSYGSMKVRQKKKSQPENASYDDNVSNFSTSSILEEFDSYMTSSSFCTKNYKAFVYEYLEPDGMFMIRMIGSNSGDFVCTQVLHNLWKLFLCKQTTLPNLRETDLTISGKIYIKNRKLSLK